MTPTKIASTAAAAACVNSRKRASALPAWRTEIALPGATGFSIKPVSTMAAQQPLGRHYPERAEFGVARPRTRPAAITAGLHSTSTTALGDFFDRRFKADAAAEVGK